MIIYGATTTTNTYPYKSWRMRPHVRSLYAHTPELVYEYDERNRKNFYLHNGAIGLDSHYDTYYHVCKFELLRVRP